MHKKKTLFMWASVLLFTSVIATVAWHGKSNRVFLSQAITPTVESPEDAYKIWEKEQVRGRILLLFDNYPHMWGMRHYKNTPQLNRTNVFEYAIFKNIIRSIYFIVPDARWEDFKKSERVNPIREVSHLERGAFLFNLNGVPIIAVPRSSLPHIAEKTLVYINTQVFDKAQVLALLSAKQISSDILISYQGNN